jgi:hypothetical protein
LRELRQGTLKSRNNEAYSDKREQGMTIHYNPLSLD